MENVISEIIRNWGVFGVLVVLMAFVIFCFVKVMNGVTTKMKKKKEEGIVVASPIKGKAVELSQVSDPTFGECMLGKGVAILPAEGKVYAPADGEISMMFETHHAVSMVTTEGIELLIHIGLETVALKGDGFEAHVQSGDQVKKGDLLVSGVYDSIRMGTRYVYSDAKVLASIFKEFSVEIL